MRYSILLDSTHLQLWQYKSLVELGKVSEAVCVHIYIKNPKSKKKVVKNRYANVLFRIFIKLCKIVESPIRDVRELFPHLPISYVEVQRKGKYKEEFPVDVINKLKEQNLDFIIRYGFGIISGDILNISKHGVWSFHHGDNQRFKGRPAGFWEMYQSEKTISGMLQVLSEKLDDGEIISTWNIKCHPFDYKRNLSQIKMAGKHELKKVVNYLRQHGNLPIVKIESSLPKHTINKLPNNVQTLKFLFEILKGFLKFNLGKFYEQNWRVLIMEKEGSKVLKQIQTSKKQGFIADPFIVKKDGNYIILAEFFNRSTKKGRIDYFILSEDFDIIDEGISLEESFHLSYPQIFEYKKDLYVIPEMAKSKRQTIYKLESTGKLYKVKDIINNVSISDPTILHYDNKWWLFGSCNENELNIWFSEDPFQKWQDHPMNPVKVDVKASRSAGDIYFEGNKLIRPTQDISNFYGERVHLNRIKKLSIDEFSENHYQTIGTTSLKIKSRGIHTINFCDDIKVIDVMDYKFRRG